MVRLVCRCLNFMSLESVLLLVLLLQVSGDPLHWGALSNRAAAPDGSDFPGSVWRQTADWTCGAESRTASFTYTVERKDHIKGTKYMRVCQRKWWWTLLIATVVFLSRIVMDYLFFRQLSQTRTKLLNNTILALAFYKNQISRLISR